MKNFDIVKWAKEEQLALSKMDGNSKYVARYIECTLLPKLEEVFHTSSNKQSTPLCEGCQRNADNSCRVETKCVYFIPME